MYVKQVEVDLKKGNKSLILDYWMKDSKINEIIINKPPSGKVYTKLDTPIKTSSNNSNSNSNINSKF